MEAASLLPKGIPGLEDSIAFAVVISLLGAWLLAPYLLATWRLALWLAALALPAAFTWTAGLGTPYVGCAIGRPWWAEFPDFSHPDVFFNIAMLIPAGAAAFLWPRGPRRAAALIVAVAEPLVLEFGQLWVPTLNRTCQLGDMANNILGVMIGFGIVTCAAKLKETVVSEDTGSTTCGTS